MADASQTVDLTTLSTLQEELTGLQAELSEAEEHWLEASEVAET